LLCLYTLAHGTVVLLYIFPFKTVAYSVVANMNLQIFIFLTNLITLTAYAEQPKANSCKYDEAGASEITCKGYVKL